MLFNSVVFLLLFLPLALILYLSLYGLLRRWRPVLLACNALLVAASLFFYAWGEPQHILVLMASVVINFFFGFILGRLPELNHGRLKGWALA